MFDRLVDRCGMPRTVVRSRSRHSPPVAPAKPRST